MSGSVFLGNSTLAGEALKSFEGKIEASFFPPATVSGGIAGGLVGDAGGKVDKNGKKIGEDPAPIAPTTTAPVPAPVPKSNISAYEQKLIKGLLGTKMKYDNKTADQILDSVSKRSGLPKSFISASALQEGMNLAIDKPDEASEAYTNAKVDPNQYPVDGFSNYGLDTFGEAYGRLVKKGYLPADFNFHPYKAYNEQKKLVTTAAFRNNEDAVLAKAAYMRDFMDTVKEEATKRGLKLEDRELKYFTMAGYNGGPGAIKVMLDEVAASGGKVSDFIKTGSKKKGQVHKNVSPRMDKMDFFESLFNSKTE